MIFGNDPSLNGLFPREHSDFLGDQKSFDSSSFNHLTRSLQDGGIHNSCRKCWIKTHYYLRSICSNVL